jgi:hypothetical protein
VQVRRRQLDVGMLVLAGTRFDGEHGAAVDLGEIAVRELAFLCRRRLVLAPNVALIEHHLAALNQGLGMAESGAAELYCHGRPVSPRLCRRIDAAQFCAACRFPRQIAGNFGSRSASHILASSDSERAFSKV